MRSVTTLFAVLLVGSHAAAAQNAAAWPPEARQFRLHMIGNSHIDAPWLWPWTEAAAVVDSTFRSALDRLNEDPKLTMTTSSSQFYEWVAQSDPEMLAEIRKRVDEGRWDLVGGWMIEPDVNIPNGESLARQGLYGQETLQRLFGKMAFVGYNPDSFGHAGSVPQILKLEGMVDYVFQRPGVNEKDIPGNLFWWQGIDGTRTLTYRIPISYTGSRASLEPKMRDVVALLSPQPLRDAMDFFGVGDHGGGPTKENLASIKAIQSEPGAPAIFYSTPDRYFAEIRHSHNIAIPVLQGDLQIHSVGCYTAESAMKKGNREAEAALVTGEKLAEVGAFAWGVHYPQDELTEAWKRLLLMQFHDSLAGTSLPEQYQIAREAQGRAMDVGEQAMNLSALRLAWQVPATDPESTYLVVFNPHAWSSTQNIEYDLYADQGATYVAEDDRNRTIPSQWVQATTVTGNRKRIIAQVNLPPFGYRQIRVRKVSAPAETTPSPLKMEANSMENEHLRVTISDGLLAIFDRDAGRELFKGGATGARAVVLNDPSDTWSHTVLAYTDEIGEFKADSVKLVESGPLRACIRVHSTYGRSALTTDWILYAGSRNLEARVTLDWHEHLKMLKFSFPVDVQNPTATYEISYGAIQRPTDGHEYPGQRWIDVTGDRDGGQYGLAVINNAKYGYSVDGSDMRVSVARAAVYAQHMPAKLDPHGDYDWQDQGVQTFRMILVPHAGSWQNVAVVHLAEELVAPPLVIYQGIHRGTRPPSASFLSIDAPDVVISAIKRAEDGNDLIVRMYETAGHATAATLNLSFLHRRWRGQFHPYEIKTLRIDPNTSKIREVNILEQ
jgi:alpha-mannosidase